MNILLPQGTYTYTEAPRPPSVLPWTSRITLLEKLPLVLIVLCLVVAFITFLAHKRNTRISTLIPNSMLVISSIMLFLFLIPLPLKKMCDISPVNGTMINCESIYMTGWKRFIEVVTVGDNRFNVPKRRGGLFTMGSSY